VVVEHCVCAEVARQSDDGADVIEVIVTRERSSHSGDTNGDGLVRRILCPPERAID
jgi:hypothetical protein